MATELNEIAVMALDNIENEELISLHFKDVVLEHLYNVEDTDYRDNEDVNDLIFDLISANLEFKDLVYMTDEEVYRWVKCALMQYVLTHYAEDSKNPLVLAMFDSIKHTGNSLAYGSIISPTDNILKWNEISFTNLLNMVNGIKKGQLAFNSEKEMLECVLGYATYTNLADEYGCEEKAVELEPSVAMEMEKHVDDFSDDLINDLYTRYNVVEFHVHTNYQYGYNELKQRFVNRFHYLWGAEIFNFNREKTDFGYKVTMMLDAKDNYSLQTLTKRISYRFGENCPRKWYAIKWWDIKITYITEGKLGDGENNVLCVSDAYDYLTKGKVYSVHESLDVGMSDYIIDNDGDNFYLTDVALANEFVIVAD